MKNLRYWLGFGIIGLMLLNIPSISAAGEVWGFEENDKLYYYIQSKEGDTVLVKGSFNVVINDITDGDVTLTVDSSFEGQDAIDYRDNIEGDDILYTGTDISFWGIKTFTGSSSVIFYSDVGLESGASNWDSFFDFIQLFVDADDSLTMTRTVSETGYTVKIEDNDSSYEFYEQREYSSTGILQKVNLYDIDNDGVKSTFTLEKSLLPLPYPNLYVYIAGGAAAVILILVVSLCCCKKKKK
ncbi:MAG: hypothetical protein DRO88_03920 [Promethearchaeia archaeon]|nr:MAG: hypothetical protein DRO88_03920 [Candidatus Lokiarchaeia archaeon]